MKSTFAIILDYCGGSNTDKLYEQLKVWNPETNIYVLDNASPINKSIYVTHQNKSNSFIGGGIKDCINLAKTNKKEFLLFVTNDVILIDQIDLKALEEMIIYNQNIVQLSVSLTASSDKSYYPWMINKGKNEIREVCHSDFIFTIIRLSFIEEFGGFPYSKSGWGYDWEFSYHARLKNKKIIINDRVRVEHKGKDENMAWKRKELSEVYNKIYGNHMKISPHTIHLNYEQNKYIVEKCKTLSPIIIIGMHRSGTSFLSSILEEAGVFMGAYKDPNNGSLVFLQVNQQCLAKTGYSCIQPGLIELRIPEDLLGIIVLKHFGYYLFNKSQIDSINERPWGWKDPINTLTLKMWLSCFPKSKIIHIYRNGMAVAESLYRHNSKESLESSYYSKELKDRSFGFNLWQKYLEAAESYKQELGSNFFSICFEKLVSGNLQEIQRLELYLGLRLQPTILKRALHDKASPRKYQRLSEFKDEKGFLKKYGYIE